MKPIPSVETYRKDVTQDMRERIEAAIDENDVALNTFAALLLSFNQKLNLVSTRSAADVDTRHIRHSLSVLAKRFPDNSVIVDWGCGGGLPSIPVAISERSVTVVGVDAVTKKTRAVASMATRIGVPNMRVWAGRAENYDGNADFSISRATAPMKTLWEWHDRIALDRFSPVTENTWQPGLICLKGGDLDEELEALLETDRTVSINVYDLAHLLNHAYFEGKFLIHVYR